MPSTTVTLPAVLNATSAVAHQASLQQAVAAASAGSTVVLDASPVQSFDSAGVALLLSLRRFAQAQGLQLVVQQWPAGLQALAKVYGVLPLLDPAAPEDAVTVA